MPRRKIYTVAVLEEIFIIEKNKKSNRKQYTDNMIDYKNEAPITFFIECQTRENIKWSRLFTFC